MDGNQSRRTLIFLEQEDVVELAASARLEMVTRGLEWDMEPSWHTFPVNDFPGEFVRRFEGRLIHRATDKSELINEGDERVFWWFVRNVAVDWGREPMIP